MRRLLLRCCCLSAGLFLASETAAQPGCKVPVSTTSAPSRIHFTGDDLGIDWDAIQVGASAWTRCSAAPQFSYGGIKLQAGFSRVSVSIVPKSQMVWERACAEAGVGILKINEDGPRACATKTWLVYVHEVGHVLGLQHARGDTCGPQGGKPGNIMWEFAGRVSDNVAVTQEACAAVRAARGIAPPPPPGGGGDGPGGGNPGGGDGPGTGTDRCVDHPGTPGCPLDCDANPHDPRCGDSDVCEYYPTSGGGFTPSPDNSEECSPLPL